MKNIEELHRLNDFIKDIKIVMLTTVEEDGSLQSRPMAVSKMENDSTLWFFTEADAHKAAEVNLESKVNVSYMDHGKDLYISISGNASIVGDRDKIKELWSPFLKAWFPNGLEDPNIALLKVEITYAEYWDVPDSKMVQIVGMAKAVIKGEQYKPGENKKININ